MTEPSILSPHGEGYCRACRFIEGLDPAGKLVEHHRGAHGLSVRYGEASLACTGSGRLPGKVTPYASRLSAFRVSAPKALCSQCHEQISLMIDGRLVIHINIRTYRNCIGGYQIP